MSFPSNKPPIPIFKIQPLYLLQERHLSFSWPWANWCETALCAPWRHQQLTIAAGGGSSWAPCHWGRRLGLTLSQWVLINIGECGQHVCPLSGLGACPIIMQTPTTTRLLRCTVGNPSILSIHNTSIYFISAEVFKLNVDSRLGKVEVTFSYEKMLCK